MNELKVGDRVNFVLDNIGCTNEYIIKNYSKCKGCSFRNETYIVRKIDLDRYRVTVDGTIQNCSRFELIYPFSIQAFSKVKRSWRKL